MQIWLPNCDHQTSTSLWSLCFIIIYLNPNLISFCHPQLQSYLFHCCIPDRWHFLFDPSWLQSSQRIVAWRSSAGLADGSSDSGSCCGPRLVWIFLISKVLGPPPGPGSMPGWAGCSRAAGLSLHNQLQSPPPGLHRPESLQSAPVKTGVESWRSNWLHSYWLCHRKHMLIGKHKPSN